MNRRSAILSVVTAFFTQLSSLFSSSNSRPATQLSVRPQPSEPKPLVPPCPEQYLVIKDTVWVGKMSDYSDLYKACAPGRIFKDGWWYRKSSESLKSDRDRPGWVNVKTDYRFDGYPGKFKLYMNDELLIADDSITWIQEPVMSSDGQLLGDRITVTFEAWRETL